MMVLLASVIVLPIVVNKSDYNSSAGGECSSHEAGCDGRGNSYNNKKDLQM